MISITSFNSFLKKKKIPLFHKIKLVSALISFLQNKLFIKWELYQSKPHVENIHLL